MKTYYRIDVVFYVEIDTMKKTDAKELADYFIIQEAFPYAVGYRGFQVRKGRMVLTAKMLERTPKVFKKEAEP